MDAGAVFSVLDQAMQNCAQVLKDVTGDPATLQAKSQELAQAVENLGKVIEAVLQEMTNLQGGLSGQGDVALRDQITNQLNQLKSMQDNLNQESQNLGNTANNSLPQATQAANSNQQDMGQQASQIIQQMMQQLAAAAAAPPPMQQILKMLAIMMGLIQSLAAKSNSDQNGQQNMNNLAQQLQQAFPTGQVVPTYRLADGTSVGGTQYSQYSSLGSTGAGSDGQPVGTLSPTSSSTA